MIILIIILCIFLIIISNVILIITFITLLSLEFLMIFLFILQPNYPVFIDLSVFLICASFGLRYDYEKKRKDK